MGQKNVLNIVLAALLLITYSTLIIFLKFKPLLFIIMYYLNTKINKTENKQVNNYLFRLSLKMAKCGEWGGNGGAVKGEMLTAKEMVDFVHGTGQESQDNYSNRESDEFKTLEWTGSSQERRQVQNCLTNQ